MGPFTQWEWPVAFDRAARAAQDAPAFTCPRCGRVSHNPHDLAAGYCGACHDWTGNPDPGSAAELDTTEEQEQEPQ